MKINIHPARFVAAVVVLFPIWVSTVAADDQPAHRVVVSGAVKSGTFAAEIDDQKFATPAALEGYLAGLPAGSVVRWQPELFNALSMSEDDVWRSSTYHRKLKEFCLAHGLAFHW